MKPAKVFVSCGQSTPDERKAAAEVKSWFQTQGFDVFVALETQSLNDINSGTIAHLRLSDYYVFIDFRREEIVVDKTSPAASPTFRGSLFSHQELALAYFLDFPESVFLAHEGVELKGIAQFQMANAQKFASFAEVSPLIQRLVNDRGWTPKYSRHLSPEKISTPITPQKYDSLGNPRFDWNFYASIRNRRTDTAASKTIGRLIRITKENGELVPLHDQSRLQWGGQVGFETTIFPSDTEALSLFAIDRDVHRHVFLHSARDIPPQHPIINVEGRYRLRYQVVADLFPLMEFDVELHHTGNIDTIAAKLI